MLHAPTNDRKTKPEAGSKTTEHLSEQEQPTHLLRSRRSQPMQQRENLAAMQNAYGNQALLRMGRSEKATTANPIQGSILQRKFTSDNSTDSSNSSCTECQKKQEIPLQSSYDKKLVGNNRPTLDFAELPLSSEDVEPDVDLAEDKIPTDPSPELAIDKAEKDSCCKWRSFESSNDVYVDTDIDSRKNIQFTCGVDYKSSDPTKCVMVNWLQGTAKNKDGTFRKVKMFEKVVDYNFPTMRIDSLDKDPVYWSSSAGRWNYKFTVGTGDTFLATDSPGPPVWQDGIDYDLKFKMCLHCIDDVSTSSDEFGSGVKNPLKCIPWNFKAKYDAAAKKFTH